MMADRITGMHVCPMITPGTPPITHIGGSISSPGETAMHIGGLPAATVGPMCVWVPPSDSIVKGSMKVMICGKPAAQIGDMSAHGGPIWVGSPTVMIGGQCAGAL